jgi:hypothetical protein
LRSSPCDAGNSSPVPLRECTDIQPEIRHQLLQPFFTTKPTGLREAAPGRPPAKAGVPGGQSNLTTRPPPAESPIFSACEISVVIRLLWQPKFVDPLKNSVDPRSNEFAL